MRSTERSAGFTLLEVLIALVVFTTVMGGLLSTLSQSVRALGNAEIEVELMELARERMRKIQRDAENGTAPPLGESSGLFAEPYDHMRWQVTSEYFAYPLPARMTNDEIEEARRRSPVFAEPHGDPSSLRLVVLRVFDESGIEVLDPFTIITADAERPRGVASP